jgi:hypothetical protein
MSKQSFHRTHRAALLVLGMLLGLSGAALAQVHGGGAGGHGGAVHAAPANQHFDGRFGHNQYYYNRGYAVRTPPHSGYAVNYGNGRYWYDGGHWYRYGAFGWVVDGAPFGAFVWFLPPFYTTVWFGGVPYYYANDVYYAWDSDMQQYQIVQPPAGIESSGTTEPPASSSLFVYPKNGQSPEQQGRDRFECHQSATQQSGYDPTQPGGGVAPAVAAPKREEYFRAEAACLTARGYSVR